MSPDRFWFVFQLLTTFHSHIFIQVRKQLRFHIFYVSSTIITNDRTRKMHTLLDVHSFSNKTALLEESKKGRFLSLGGELHIFSYRSSYYWDAAQPTPLSEPAVLFSLDIHK